MTRLNFVSHELLGPLRVLRGYDILIESVATAYRLLSAGHEIRVTRESSPFSAVADRIRIETIVSNVVDNAMKYSPGGGVVSVNLARGEQRVYVTVRDEGIGIAGEDLGKLFQRFPQTLNDTLVISGIRIGPHISRETARRHGGDNHVQSHLGNGSAFQAQPADPGRPGPRGLEIARNPAGRKSV